MGPGVGKEKRCLWTTGKWAMERRTGARVRVRKRTLRLPGGTTGSEGCACARLPGVWAGGSTVSGTRVTGVDSRRRVRQDFANPAT